MPSPITQNIGSAASAVGLGPGAATQSSQREVASAASTTQVAQAIQVNAEKSSTQALEDKRRTARAPAARVEGSYSPQDLKNKKAKKAEASEEKSDGGTSEGDSSKSPLDTVA